MGISDKQRKILAFSYTKNYQTLICDGAVRSGKTSIMTIAFIDWAMREFDNTNFAICGKTVGSAIKNIIVPYISLSYAKDKYGLSFTRSDNKLTVRYGGKTNTFYIYGGKDESSYMLIQGITLAGVLFDEVALMARSFVEQALARCLSFEQRRYWFNCNPENPNHWFYKEWILKAKEHRALHLHFLMTDNPAISAKTLKEAEITWTGVFYDRYVLGQWVKAEGLVYPRFDKEKHCFSDYQPSANSEYYISCDYGTVNPCSMGLWEYDGFVARRIKEHYFNSREEGFQKTDEEHYSSLVELAGDNIIQAVIVDPSAASFIELIRRRGIFSVVPANNSVIDGIRTTASLLNSGRLMISKDCVASIEEFGLYSWDEKAGKDIPIKTDDHAMDDIRYFVYTIMRRNYSDFFVGAVDR